MLQSQRTMPEIADEFNLSFAALVALLESPLAEAELVALRKLNAIRAEIRVPIQRDTALARLTHIAAFSLDELEARRAASSLLRIQSQSSTLIPPPPTPPTPAALPAPTDLLAPTTNTATTHAAPPHRGPSQSSGHRPLKPPAPSHALCTPSSHLVSATSEATTLPASATPPAASIAPLEATSRLSHTESKPTSVDLPVPSAHAPPKPAATPAPTITHRVDPDQQTVRASINPTTPRPRHAPPTANPTPNRRELATL